MNYYLVQTTYFLVFVLIGVSTYVVTPIAQSLFSSVSDDYAKSQITRIQGEMLFIDGRRGNFQGLCTTGVVGELVQDLIREYGKKVVCRTNDDKSAMIVYAQLRSGDYYCADSRGASCRTHREPHDSFSCKDF